MAKNQETPQIPKYTIGQEVYFMRDAEVMSGPIIGVLAVFDHAAPSIIHKRREVFREFLYTLVVRRIPSGYDWISENRIFATKEDLLASL